MVCCFTCARLERSLCLLTWLCEAAGPNDLLRAPESRLFASLTTACRLCIRCLYGREPRGAIIPMCGASCMLGAHGTWATEDARIF